MREFTAMTENEKGGTQAVTVKAWSEEDARQRLAKQNYFKVLWVL